MHRARNFNHCGIRGVVSRVEIDEEVVRALQDQSTRLDQGS